MDDDDKTWEPVSDLEIRPMGIDGEMITGDEDVDARYAETLIGHMLDDAYGFSVIAVCTGRGQKADEELARLVLSGLKIAAAAKELCEALRGNRGWGFVDQLEQLEKIINEGNNVKEETVH